MTADTSDISDADGLGAFSYQWYRDGAEIVGATSGTYMLDKMSVGASIRVEVSYTDGAGTNESVISVDTDPVASLPTGSGNDIPIVTDDPDSELKDPDDTGVVINVDTGGEILGEVYTNSSSDEAFEGYKLEPYKIPDHEVNLYSDTPGLSNFLKYAIRPIVQAGTDITEELLQLFDLVRIEVNEVDDKSSGIFLASAGSVVMSLSIGAVAWVIHGASVAASMLSSVSAIKGLDPMPFIDNCKKRKNGKSLDDEDDKDNQLDNMFDGGGDDEEVKSVSSLTEEKDLS